MPDVVLFAQHCPRGVKRGRPDDPVYGFRGDSPADAEKLRRRWIDQNPKQHRPLSATSRLARNARASDHWLELIPAGAGSWTTLTGRNDA